MCSLSSDFAVYYTTLHTTHICVCERTCIKCETPAHLFALLLSRSRSLSDLSLSLLLFVYIVIDNIIYLSVRIVSHKYTNTYALRESTWPIYNG